jgi:methyltransferase family protein
MSEITCPLCKSLGNEEFFRDKKRIYLRCSVCNLIYVPREFYLSNEAEKAEYDLHQNNPDDSGYRRFLTRMFDPINERLQAGSHGLDFGSGPGPTLSVMFEEAGHTMALYDKFYASDSTVLNKEYDFITATEVVEHLHKPKIELDRLWGCLKPGGVLGIMTKLALGLEEFTTWHYKNDMTHVCFFSKATFEWLAEEWQAEVRFVHKDVILFHCHSKG